METGVGEKNVRRVSDWLFALRPELVISAGFAGALRSDLKPGDVVWPDQHRPLVTPSRLIPTTQGKQALADSSGAAMVDMESAIWEAACEGRGIRFAAVRAISDALDDELSPRLVKVLGRERVSIPKLLAATVREPRIIPQLWRLARNTRAAADALAAELHSYLRNNIHSASQTSVSSDRSF